MQILKDAAMPSISLIISGPELGEHAPRTRTAIGRCAAIEKSGTPPLLLSLQAGDPLSTERAFE